MNICHVFYSLNYGGMIDGILALNINDKDGYLEITGTSKLPQLAAQLRPFIMLNIL
jgi:hypothetical protein